MKELKKNIVDIYREDRGILIMMILVFIFSLVFFIFSCTRLNTTSAIVKIGYGDIGGYRDGAWNGLLTFPVLAFIFGILHNLLAIRIYGKRGVGMTKFFLATTIMLIFSALLVLVRLSSEV